MGQTITDMGGGQRQEARNNVEKKNIHLATTLKHFTKVCKLLFQSKVKQSSSAIAARVETFNRQRKVTLYLWLEWLEAGCSSGEDPI